MLLLQGALVQSLVRKLRSHMLHGMAKENTLLEASWDLEGSPTVLLSVMWPWASHLTFLDISWSHVKYKGCFDLEAKSQHLYSVHLINPEWVNEVAQLCPTLCDPCPWDSPGKNTGVGCHFLLQGILPTQESNLCLLRLLHWQADSLPLHHLGSPVCHEVWLKYS